MTYASEINLVSLARFRFKCKHSFHFICDANMIIMEADDVITVAIIGDRGEKQLTAGFNTHSGFTYYCRQRALVTLL